MDRTPDEEIVRLQRSQYGLVSTAQLRELKLSDASVRWRVDDNQLLRARRSVLANPGAPASFEQLVMAAVLAGGQNAYASHESSLQLWTLPLPAAAALEITTLLERRPRVRGVRCHRSGLLIECDVTVLRGIPLSTRERSIVDVSSRFDVRILGRMVDDALRRRLTTMVRLQRAVDRLAPAPGRSAKKMNLVLQQRDGNVASRESILEDFVFDALVRFDVPLPVPQYRVILDGCERRIDLCYPRCWLALEAQGFATHGLRHRFDDDALRGNELQLAGFRVLQFTSAFTDWQIASQVARSLEVEVPPRPPTPLTFAEWTARRDRLDDSSRDHAINRPNGR